MVNLIKYLKWFWNLRFSLFNKILLRYKNVTYNTFPVIRGRIHMYGTGKIILGANIIINSSPYVNPIGGDTRTVIKTGPNAVLEIGDFTGISNATIVCFNSITIGKHVNIGGGVKIYDTDFHSLDFQKRKSKLTDIPNTKPIKIGDFCFIGAHSIILKGVCIGNNSIIGAGSVVTKLVPENEIWAGNPAKFIKLLNY